jgi:hypothetical protein
MKEFALDELCLAMYRGLTKQASGEAPGLAKAAEYLHAALEILESQGLQTQADRLLQVMEKIGQSSHTKLAIKPPSLEQLMQAGVTQRDLFEFAKGNPIAVAKLNLVLRKLGAPDHEISKFLGPTNLMSEDDARKAISPNHPGFASGLAQKSSENVLPLGEGQVATAAPKRPRNPGRPDKIKDPATRGLTPEKEVKNILEHGHPLNVTMADDCAIDVPPPIKRDTLTKEDMVAGFGDLLDAATFDIDASDDELMEMEVRDDSLEVLEKDMPLEDFEDERD